MTTGLDAAAGAVGFASLGVLLLQGCVKGFVLLRTAQNFGKDADVTRSEMEYEQYRLFKWAEKVGLESGGSPTRNMNWEIVHGHLKRLESLLNETARFKSNYRLELISTEEKLSVDDVLVPKKGFRRMFKSEFHSETARTLQSGVSVWKRLRWAAIDREGIGLLMGDIRRFVDDLWALLQYDDLEIIRSGVEALLRHAICQTEEPTELSQIEAIIHPKMQAPSRFQDGAVKSALSLKQQSLMFGYGESSHTSASSLLDLKAVSKILPGTTLANSQIRESIPRGSPTSRTKAPRRPSSYKLLTLGTESSQDLQSRELATYDGKQVLVEWKYVERVYEQQLKHRIKTLATLLQDIDSSTFHSLKCFGYLKDPKSENYGYIFQTPPGSSSFIALDRLLEDHSKAPSLDDRLALAIALVETVLQLHTSGWLHKGLRSENIIFFQQKTESSFDITKVFLEGYEYARAANPSDMTESPKPQQEANLYRHPALLRADRASFRKVFDLYGLGCVLTEIGLWENMTTILLHFHRRKDKATSSLRIMPSSLTYESEEETTSINKTKIGLLEERGAGSIQSALEFAAGKTYASVVRTCLSAGDTVVSPANQEEDSDGDSEDDRCLDLELEILDKLKRCRN